MSKYLVVRCRTCFKPLLTKLPQKNKLCPFCGKNNVVSEMKTEGYAENTYDARRIIATIRLRDKQRGMGTRKTIRLKP